MEKEGKTCRLIIKVCRPDDECEYACGVDERRTRARLFVEGKNSLNLFFTRTTEVNVSLLNPHTRDLCISVLQRPQ